MVEATAERLAEFLEDRVGDSLRSVVIVEEEGFSLVTISDSLRKTYSQDTFTEVVNTFRLDEPFLKPGTQERPIGERRAIVHYHEKAFVLQFPITERKSILVSLERDAGRHLLEFIEECRLRVAARQ